MIWLTTTLSTAVDNANRLIQKVLRLGKQDVQTAVVSAPYGVDSNAVKDMIAIYASSSMKGDNVILGYINKNALAEVGGLRLFSTNAAGEEQFYVYLRASNNLELGGTERHLARFEELETAFNDLKGKWNAFASAYVPGGPLNVGLPSTAQSSSADISQCKIENITVE